MGGGGGGQQNKMGKYIFTNLVAPNKLIGEFLITNLRIDNGDFCLISLSFTFWLISLWLYDAS